MGAEVNRAWGARRRELDRALTAVLEVGVEPPAETSIELLRAVDIRDGMVITSSFRSIVPTRESVVASLLWTAVLLMTASWVGTQNLDRGRERY
jgi:hypothetical protein